MSADKRPRIAVIGGGVSGLATAHYLLANDADITVYEASSQLGGLGSYFDYNGRFLERFYHCMLPSDQHLLSLLEDLHLSDDVYWKDSSFGIIDGNRLFGLNTPLDLLRFSPLRFVDRIRVGVTGLWGTLRSARGLDDITCEQWLTRLSGSRAFNVFWKPMLQSKFGDRYRTVPALWFWTRFNREKGAKKERKGYLRGGYKRISDSLAQSLQQRGVRIEMNCPIQTIGVSNSEKPTLSLASGETQEFDKIIYAGPIAMLGPLTQDDELGRTVKGLGRPPEMQGVINSVLLLRRGFTPHYWVATPESTIPFQGIVESSTLLEREDTAGHHMIYLMNYVHRSDPLFSESDDQIQSRYIAGLRSIFPDFQEQDIVDSFVFRSPFVEPIYSLGYLNQRPPNELVANRVYLSTSAQVYPQVTSWNGSVGLAKEVSNQVLTGSTK